MADQSINFRIGSTFSGEGFKAAQQSIGDINRKVGNGVKAFNQLSGALGQSASSMGKAAQAATGMIQSFMQGGIAGAAFAATMVIINHYMEEAQKECERLRKAAADMERQVGEALSDALAENIKQLTNEVRDLTGEFDRITEHANAFTAAMNGLRSSQGGAEIANLEVEKYNAIMAAVGEAEKANIAATYDLRIAKVKEANSIASAQAKYEAAQKATIDGEERILKIKQQIATAQNKRYFLKDVAAQNDDRDTAKKIGSEISRIEEMEVKLKRDLENQIAKNKVARVNEETAQNELKSATAKAALDTVKAADKVKVTADEGLKRQIENATKELAKLTEEQRLADEELRKSRIDGIKKEIAENKSLAASFNDISRKAQEEFAKTFAWYRDPTLAAKGVSEERSYNADLKRLQKDAQRGGNRSKVDELSRLIAAGDSKGMSDTLETWRKRKSFTPEVEAMVRAAAADKTRTTAEAELRKIESNTAGLSAKLDELLAIKG